MIRLMRWFQQRKGDREVSVQDVSVQNVTFHNMNREVSVVESYEPYYLYLSLGNWASI